MQARIDGVRIRGIAGEIPAHHYAVTDLVDSFGEKKIKRIQRSTGVEEIHTVRPGMTAADLCEAAAKRLLAKLEVPRDSIDGIIFSSFSPDYRSPATSILLQDRLGLSKETVAMDIAYGCSGYVYGLYQSSLMLKAGGCRRVLLCAGETQSLMINEQDRAMKVILGDGGSATLLELDETSGEMMFCLRCDGSGYRDLLIEAGGFRLPRSENTCIEEQDEDGNVRTKEDLRMDGMGVMQFSLREVPQAVSKVLNMAQLEKAEVDIFAMHQPNKLILEQLKMDMDVPSDKMPIGLQKTGNTSAASIPVLLSVLKGRGYDFTTSKHAVICGFGIGLSLGAVLTDLSETDIMELEELN